jgi:hypothetical protein
LTVCLAALAERTAERPSADTCFCIMAILMCLVWGRELCYCQVLSVCRLSEVHPTLTPTLTWLLSRAQRRTMP